MSINTEVQNLNEQTESVLLAAQINYDRLAASGVTLSAALTEYVKIRPWRLDGESHKWSRVANQDEHTLAGFAKNVNGKLRHP